MHIDVTQDIGNVTREVSTRAYEGKPARVVVVSRHYETSPADLWEAITSADRIPRWFMPIAGDLKLGGRYKLQGNAGGQILISQPPRHLKVTWEYSGEMSWVEVRIAKDGTGSQLTLEHASHGGDEHWNKFGPGATGVGWDLAILGLSNTSEPVLQRRPRKAWPGRCRRTARPSCAPAARPGAAPISRRRRPSDGGSGCGADDCGVYGRLMHAFDVLGDPGRRRILELLASGEHSSGELPPSPSGNSASRSRRCRNTCACCETAALPRCGSTARGASTRSMRPR